MAQQRAILTVTDGPNQGDAVRLDAGTCRLIGRHLSENETVMIDRDGNRLLDGHASKILTDHLHDRTPEVGITPTEGFSAEAFDRGADIILSDDSISRAHAMVFLDPKGFGVIDLASTNGTFLDEDRIGTAIVESGKTIVIGTSKLELTLE